LALALPGQTANQKTQEFAGNAGRAIGVFRPIKSMRSPGARLRAARSFDLLIPILPPKEYCTAQIYAAAPAKRANSISLPSKSTIFQSHMIGTCFASISSKAGPGDERARLERNA
jgi:hypothetical protein